MRGRKEMLEKSCCLSDGLEKGARRARSQKAKLRTARRAFVDVTRRKRLNSVPVSSRRQGADLTTELPEAQRTTPATGLINTPSTPLGTRRFMSPTVISEPINQPSVHSTVRQRSIQATYKGDDATPQYDQGKTVRKTTLRMKFLKIAVV